jgi:hypothetical protein
MGCHAAGAFLAGAFPLCGGGAFHDVGL